MNIKAAGTLGAGAKAVAITGLALLAFVFTVQTVGGVNESQAQQGEVIQLADGSHEPGGG